ncbi:hypothetical protein [Nocardioides speluncae]|uniref:hypothetical protein n=1 Tax=Nocardioides speluncae TaxID=2670337 RepID=UPI000D6900E5|nr:hypothetical protein [Nocardioides speluncae]
MGNPAAAIRVANTIATFKWIVIGLIVLAMFVVPAVVFFGVLEGEDLAPLAILLLAVAALVGGVLGSIIAWVLFGWFEQTLRMLAMVAGNTTTAAPALQPQQAYYR